MKIIYGLVVLAVSGLTSCEDQTADIPGMYEIEEGSLIELGSGIDLGLEVASIDDGRCPADVQCVRAGEVMVPTTISLDQKILSEITMCKGECRPNGQITVLVFDVGGLTYELELLEVNPYPKQANADDRRSAKFEVREK